LRSALSASTIEQIPRLGALVTSASAMSQLTIGR